MSACREATPTPEPTAAPSPTTEASPTVVARIEPTATPTIDPAEQPLYPGERAEVPGVPIPLGARIVDIAPATADADLRVQLALDDYDAELIYDWYIEHMPDFGWGDVEDRDGSLIFLHDKDLSQRFIDDGLNRTATVLFIAIEEDADWTLIVEAPEGATLSDADAQGDADEADDGAAAEDAQESEEEGRDENEDAEAEPDGDEEGDGSDAP
jgi:hypothetical protein